ncbi:MAG: ATP-binding protein [Bacillota bacterium]
MKNNDKIEKLKNAFIEQNQVSKSLFSTLDLGFFFIDIDQQTIWLDQRSSALFNCGESQEFPLGKLINYIQKPDLEKLLNQVNSIWDNKEQFNLKIPLENHSIKMVGKPIKIDQNSFAIQGFIYLVFPNKIVLENTENKTSILSNMTHEIRTLLNAVKGYAELLNETVLDETQKNYVLHIQDTSKHLSKIVNDILDYSKLEAGKMQIDARPFKLEKLLDEVHSMLKEQTKQKHLYLDIMNIDCPKTLIGDAYRIRQILINFVSNASKFTEIGGISITCHVDHEIDNHHIMAHFKIKDTGIGISLQELPRIFEAFDQANASTSRLYGGTGLGLNISRKIAHLMHGDITVESKVNEGSTFTLTLPLEYNPVTQNLETELDKKIRKGSKILLVEDNLLNQKLSERILSNLEMKVTIAENGLIATNLFKQHHYDLILMDIHMPTMDGYEATRIIRKYNQIIPIIAMSSDALYDDEKTLQTIGFSDVIEKPVDPNILFKALIKWLSEN